MHNVKHLKNPSKVVSVFQLRFVKWDGPSILQAFLSKDKDFLVCSYFLSRHIRPPFLVMYGVVNKLK